MEVHRIPRINWLASSIKPRYVFTCLFHANMLKLGKTIDIGAANATLFLTVCLYSPGVDRLFRVPGKGPPKPVPNALYF